jgi:hypothetical protein
MCSAGFATLRNVASGFKRSGTKRKNLKAVPAYQQTGATVKR